MSVSIGCSMCYLYCTIMCDMVCYYIAVLHILLYGHCHSFVISADKPVTQVLYWNGNIEEISPINPVSSPVQVSSIREVGYTDHMLQGQL